MDNLKWPFNHFSATASNTTVMKASDVRSTSSGSSYQSSSRNTRKIQEVVCVETPRKILLYFQDGGWQTAGAHTQMAFGQSGEAAQSFSTFLKAAGFAFTEASQFIAPRTYRSDGTTMDGAIEGDEIHWSNGTVTRIPEFPDFY